MVAERGPVDFLAYLAALADLGRRSAGPDLTDRLRGLTAEAMAHVDLLVVIPLESPDLIRVPDDEDPELRAAMDAHLLDLCEEDELVGSVPQVLEVVRLARVAGGAGPGRRRGRTGAR